MSDQDFELRLQRVLLADAEVAVRPFDAVELATTAAAAGPIARRPLDWRPSGWPWIRLMLVAGLLILAAMATLWLVTVGGPRRPSLVDVVQSPRPSGQTEASGPVLNRELVGSWIAPSPANLVIAGRLVVDPFVLGFDPDEAFLPIGSGRERMPSAVTTLGADELQLVTRPGLVDDVTLAGEELRACAAGEEGTYRATRSQDGLLLTLEAIADACPSRPAVLARTWTRYLGRPSGGGIGVVDAFDPLFTVTLPAGSYADDRTPGNITLRQAAAPALEFVAWKDPQGFNDPCDPLGKGRRPIANAADFVDYFRQLPGFTVDAVESIQLDGRPATHIKLHANPDASCPAGWLVQWQPAEISGPPYWYLRPGDSDSLYLVDLADATLMFEMLAGPQDLDAQVIPSIHILEDGLPTSP